MSKVPIHPSITKHLLVAITQKRERFLTLKAHLEKYNFSVAICTDMYEGLATIRQDMPHFIITESFLSDGSATSLFDTLEKEPPLNRIPIIVQVLKKTRQELEEVSKRKFSAFLLGACEPGVVVNKLAELLKSFGNASPFFSSTYTLPFNKAFHVRVQSVAVGQTSELFVCKSAVEIDLNAKMIINPKDPDKKPILIKSASNMTKEDQHYNLFPKRTIQGPGRIWVESLSEMNLGSAYPPAPNQVQSQEQQKQVIYYDKDRSRGEQICEFLGAHDIVSTYTDNLKRVYSILAQRAEDIDCVYLHELGNTANDIEFKNDLKKLKDGTRPPFLIATASMSARSSAAFTFIRTPFGLNKMLQAFEMCFVNSLRSKNAAEPINLVGESAEYNIVAKLIGIDEIGGVLQTSFALRPGTSFTVGFEVLQEVWSKYSETFTITGCMPLPKQENVWQSRFEVISGTGSRLKLWQASSSQLEAYTKSL